MGNKIIEHIKAKAKAEPKRIVFPEGGDDRILYAVVQIRDEGIAKPIVLGNVDDIKWRAGEHHLNFEGIELIDPKNSSEFDRYVSELVEIRKNKGLSYEDACELIKDNTYYGTMMVQLGDADGLVSGAAHSTANTIRPALQIIKVKDGCKLASSFFIMIVEDKPYFFSDCGFVINPNAEELSEIALSTAESARSFGVEPKVAMLSFSTHGSAKDASVDKVIEATRLVREKSPELAVDGEMQLDAAIVPSVANSKCPGSSVGGEANVLIFPDLNSGNIGYKLVERFGHAKALGPVVQGLNKPVNDLSRGCSVLDIVEVTAITVVEAQAGEKVHIGHALKN